MQDKALVPDVIAHNAAISKRRESLLPASLYKFLDQHVPLANEAPQTLFIDAAISKRKSLLPASLHQFLDQHVPVANKAPQTPLFTDEERQDLQLKVRKLQHDIMRMDRDRRSVFQQLLHSSRSHCQQ